MINSWHKINLETPIENITFHLRWCIKQDVNLYIGIINTIHQSMRHVSILGFLLFFNY